MCIIVYKPRHVTRPPRRILKDCWKRNDDGAGIAKWNVETKKWDVKKGLMLFNQFWKAWRDFNILTEDVVIAHFRIGTAGDTNSPEMTHPFPVTNTLNSSMQQLEFSSPNIVFHNGVHGFGEKEYSDTCVAIRDIVDPLHPYLKDDKVFQYLSTPLETDMNRWIITDENQIYQYGYWEEQDGIEYSNETFKQDRYTRASSYNYNDDHNTFGFPLANGSQTFRKADGTFDWDAWEARGGAQSQLPWNQAETIPPNENEEDDEAVVIDIDVDGKPHPEPVYNQDRASDLLCCPNCYHDKYLDNSPFNIGDTICLICGAVFTELTGQVHTFDHSIHDKWTEQIEKEASNG